MKRLTKLKKKIERRKRGRRRRGKNNKRRSVEMTKEKK